MTALTQRDRYIVALTKRGEKRVKATFRYVVYTRALKPGTFYYIGRNGALRYGPTIGASHPCNDRFKAKLLEEGAGE